MLEFLIGWSLGAALASVGCESAREDGPPQCSSRHAFAGGEEIYQCRLVVGHPGGHRGGRIA